MGSIRVGRPDVAPDTPSHVKGVHQGNQGPYHKQVGHNADGTADARRSTGVAAGRHGPILAIMPNLSPA